MWLGCAGRQKFSDSLIKSQFLNVVEFWVVDFQNYFYPYSSVRDKAS